MDQSIICFLIEAATHGYVGFGLSPGGGMNGADVIIGGVFANGTTYFTDRWATAKREPKIDDIQNWSLISASENDTHTIVKCCRDFNTCDKAEDLPIDNATTKIIWSIGGSDVIQHHVQRGSHSVYLLDPAPPEFDVSGYDPWDLEVNTALPPNQDTVYWCTMHKSPVFTEIKRHIVAFQMLLDSDLALAHTHHLILHACNGNAQLFENYTIDKHPGGLCYAPDGTGISDLLAYCSTYFYVWAKGGDPLLLPDDVGFPLNEDYEPKYFMQEIHYDFPNKDSGNIQYPTGLRVYTTPNLREHDAGVMTVGNYYSRSMLIPPNTDSYVLNGHCSSACTQSTIPATGINVYNVLLHSHLAGRKIYLRHFRKGEELPWIATDGHYDFNYQQNRPLLENRVILPGDQLTAECTDSTTGVNRTTFGGFSTSDEMCDCYLMYWPQIKDIDLCGSALRAFDWFLPIFGIEALDSYFGPNDPTVLAPASLAGKKFSEVVNAFNWTPEIKMEVQNGSRYGLQQSFCLGSETAASMMTHKIPRDGISGLDDGTVGYPDNYVPYELPPDNCN